MQSSNFPQSQQHTWSQIVGIVEGANLKQTVNTKIQQSNRKKAYRYELNKQIQQNYRNKILEQNRKLRERTELEEKVVQEKHDKIMDRYKKMKTEQKYGTENLQLAKSIKKNTCQTVHYGQNPFISLVDQQDMRNKQTRLNFQLQNKINDMQVNMHRNKSLQQRKEEEKIKKEFQNYVEKEHARKQRERENFKNKYLMMKKWESQTMNMSTNESLEKCYVNFLNHQVQQLKTKRYREKEAIDGPISAINKHAEIPDSSPAYLGRSPYSNDRKRQLDILDSATFGRNNIKKMRAGSQMNKSLGFDHMTVSLDPNTINENEKKRAQSNFKVLPSLSKYSGQYQPQIEKPTLFKKSIDTSLTPQLTKFNPEQSKSSMKVYSERGSEPKQPVREKKNYFQYNFITGDHKTFFL